MCVCADSYHQINGKCSRCPQNTMFDGQYCGPISSVAQISCNSNEVLVNGKCVCREGWFNIQGKCYACPDNTFWNGAYCQSTIPTTNWCMGKPYTEYNNGSCNCMDKFVLLDGCCVRSA